MLSLRAWRGQVVLITAAATCGAMILALTLGSEIGQTVVSPGALSLQHSTYKSQCSDCHVNASSETPALAWLHSQSTPDRHLANSRACLKCHNLGPDSFTAHALPPMQLDGIARVAALDKNASAGPWALRVGAALGGNPKSRPSSGSCNVCHFEHLGKQSNLIRISDLQCQACHLKQFASFSHGHPAFNAYPFRRRTRIEFDHRSHIQTHFKDERFSKLAPASCSACHTPEPKSGSMLVNSFDETCSACHLDQIKGKGQAAGPGIAVIRLPGLDVQALTSHGIDIGAWPEGADGMMTPFMEWLLGATNLASVDLLDLSKAGTSQLNQAADLAWSIKELIYDLSERGHVELERRLESALHGGLSSRQSEAVAGLLSPDVVQSMRRKWFPNLDSEIAQHRSGNKLVSPAGTNAATAASSDKASDTKAEEWVALGGWYRSDLEYSLSYRPIGHADPFLQSWLELTASAPGAQKLFAGLSKPNAPGLCVKCHSIDDQPQPLLNWRGVRPDSFDHPFTHFSHTAHFSLLDDRGCQTCHSLDLNASTENYAASFAPANRDPAAFRSNFNAIQLPVCSSCHSQKYAGEGCLECHNYHIGHFMPTLPRQQWGTSLPKLSP